MNFSQAVRGPHTRGGDTKAIQSQAETELGRKLNREEERFLSVKYTPSSLLGEIDKVCQYLRTLYCNIFCFQYGYGFLKFLLFFKDKAEMKFEVRVF